MATRRSLLRRTTHLSCLLRHSLPISKTFALSPRPILLRQYAFLPTHPRLEEAHLSAPTKNWEGSVEGLDRTAVRQQYPLSGYYLDILNTRSPYLGPATSSRPVIEPTTLTEDKPSPSSTVQPQSPQDRMAIVFGSRLASPGYRSSRLPPESTWKTVNGVAIPPRPEEPDNCCMSGCVHCVWDDYREAVEEWAARLEEARAKVHPSIETDIRSGRRPEVASASLSMDDDGGGSETNWALPSSQDGLFADIPVGIREFMKTEKRLRQKHREKASA